MLYKSTRSVNVKFRVYSTEIRPETPFEIRFEFRAGFPVEFRTEFRTGARVEFRTEFRTGSRVEYRPDNSGTFLGKSFCMKGRERATYTIQKYDKVCWSCHKNGSFGTLRSYMKKKWRHHLDTLFSLQLEWKWGEVKMKRLHQFWYFISGYMVSLIAFNLIGLFMFTFINFPTVQVLKQLLQYYVMTGTIDYGP